MSPAEDTGVEQQDHAAPNDVESLGRDRSVDGVDDH